MRIVERTEELDNALCPFPAVHHCFCYHYFHAQINWSIGKAIRSEFHTIRKTLKCRNAAKTAPICFLYFITQSYCFLTINSVLEFSRWIYYLIYNRLLLQQCRRKLSKVSKVSLKMFNRSAFLLVYFLFLNIRLNFGSFLLKNNVYAYRVSLAIMNLA